MSLPPDLLSIFATAISDIQSIRYTQRELFVPVIWSAIHASCSCVGLYYYIRSLYVYMFRMIRAHVMVSIQSAHTGRWGELRLLDFLEYRLPFWQIELIWVKKRSLFGGWCGLTTSVAKLLVAGEGSIHTGQSTSVLSICILIVIISLESILSIDSCHVRVWQTFGQDRLTNMRNISVNNYGISPAFALEKISLTWIQRSFLLNLQIQ